MLYYLAQLFRVALQRVSFIGQPEVAPLYAVVPEARGWSTFTDAIYQTSAVVVFKAHRD